MAIRLPKPKKAQSLPPIEPSFDNVHQVDEIIATEAGTSFVTLTEMHEGFNNRRFFDWHGRVSRVQFLAYSTFNVLIALMLVALLFVMIGGFQGMVNASIEQLPMSLLGASSVGVAVLFYLQLAVSKRRFNDLNKTGWLALLMLVPGVNVLVYLYLLAIEGTAGANYYGLPARPASQLKTVLMLLIPLLVMSLIGLLTQIVMPSYHSYQSYQGMKNNRDAQKNVIVTATNPSQSAQILPATASAVAASTTQPENLRTKAVVITGEQLGNGVASNPQPTAPANVNPAMTTNQVSTDTLANTPSRTNQMPEAPIDTANPNTLNPNSLNPNNLNQGSNERAQTGSNPTTNAPNSQGVVSYEDFVKASEQQIFIDRR
ncbi:hypothetical protein AFK20_03200 [Enhydrobacter aerosaccus]|uniref:DUF805 domain-containing protein n=1 Tax=Enhydrobacter aerosaccus TaxID=225324 RepID=A0ABR5IPR1_9HYPH|nr:DUF805 domain-containing protein [Enhydrobacter aerosaccus]KND23076.1 hypothetical protein AFK20_03200 [Enhydrobacter aerosaccus]